MPLPNGPIGIITNPLLISPFIQNWSVYFPSPPPGTSYMITEDGNRMVTEGIKLYMITE